MLKDDQRLCDICDEVIPRGIEYRAGWTIPEAVEEWFEEQPDPSRHATFSVEPDGTVRFEVCMRCVMEHGGELMKLTEARVDHVQ